MNLDYYTENDLPAAPARQSNSHKGSFGTVLVIGGARPMPGAPSLVANAALRSGSGLVRLALPESIQLTVAGLAPCATSVPLCEDAAGRLGVAALPQLLESLSSCSAVALGPGLGQSGPLQSIVKALLHHRPVKPIVVDADGLNNLYPNPSGPAEPFQNDQLVLTPHPGEMKRLWKRWYRESLPTDREQQAVLLAKRVGAVIVLKGHDTVVTDGVRIYLNPTGNPGMATGGTGDVLTGCIASLLGQGLSPFDAAMLGTWLHGTAGDIASATYTAPGMIATDVIACLPDAWSCLLARTELAANPGPILDAAQKESRSPAPDEA